MATISEGQVNGQRQRPCPWCGQVSADARYCPECGHALDAPAANGEAPTVEQRPSVLPPPVAYPPPPMPRGAAPSAPAGSARPSRRRVGAIAGVLALAVVIGAVVLIVATSGSGSGPDPSAVYRQKLTTVLAPVVAANTALSNTLQALHGASTSAATSAANQAEQAVVSARGAMSVLAPPAGSQQLSQQAQQALTQESGYLGTAAATLSSPSPGNIAQLQPLATSLQSAFVPLAAIASGGTSSISGTSALNSWASGRIAAAAQASAAANRAAQRKAIQQAATKAAQQAVANSNGASAPVSAPSYVPSSGVQSLPTQCGYGVAGSAGVSCPFAENAFYEYWNATGGNPTYSASISAWSAEGQSYYPLSCGSGDGVVDCTGTNASGVFLDARFTQAAVLAYTQNQAAAYAASGKPGPNG
jgi:hypothetical protein